MKKKTWYRVKVTLLECSRDEEDFYREDIMDSILVLEDNKCDDAWRFADMLISTGRNVEKLIYYAKSEHNNV